MNFNKKNLGIDLNNFGDSLTEIERRNKSIVSALCKVQSKTLRELLTKVGLTTVGSKQDLRLRLCRYFSQKLETEDKDPNFSGTYFTSKATQDQIESIIAEQSATSEDSEDEILDSEVKGLTEDLENKLAILNNTVDSSANSLATISANTNIISNDTNLTIPIDQGTSSVIPTISPDNINKLFNATNTALSIVNTLIDNTSNQTKPTSATQNQTKNHTLTTEPIKMTPKIHISKFEGKSEEDLQEFLNLFNRFSKLNNWSNENKADYINFYLQGAALVSLQNFLALGDKTWQEIVDHLSCRFGQNKTLDYSVQLQYLKLEPQLMSLETYIHTVEKLSTALNMSEEMKFLESTEESLPDLIKINAAEHLRSLATTFRIYFPEPDPDDSWIRNPFNCQAIEQIHGLTEEEQDKLVDLSSCGTMKDIFNGEKIADFWATARKDYKELGDKAMKKILPFATTYRCEQAFSSMCFMKNKYRNRLDMQSDFRVKVSSLEPNITEIMDSKVKFNLSH
ncbi:hypothetical protein WDU94_012193 [Cyamophila willieti]